MAHIIAAAITFIISNYALTFFVIGLLFSAAAIIRLPRPLSAGAIVEKLLAWHVFFAIGVSFLWNFVIHAFFGELAARFIGWPDSPFQIEVGTASLGFAAVGFLAAFGSFELRLGAILGPAFFSLGAAVVHLHQMVMAHNFAPGNAGAVFYMDILVPLFGFLLLWLQRRYDRSVALGLRSPPRRPDGAVVDRLARNVVVSPPGE